MGNEGGIAMSHYKKLKNQPLRFVLAEFRFSPVMNIAEYIPKIQEALRKQYPISQKGADQAIQLGAGGITVSTMDRWAFVSSDKKNAVSISQERLVYITADYDRFGGFSVACRQAIDVLATIVEPSLILRIGLRYGDLIRPDEGEKVSSLINEHFVYPECLQSLGDMQQKTTETLLQTTMGGLVIRTLHGQHGLTCLPDMQGLPITISQDVQPSERLILDIDHFWDAKEETVSFESNDVINKLDMLHEISREAFWKITTDYARNQKWS
jgi:uncharacterized protein (TIGR04255 family)